jgi:hypothetical protein
MTHWTIKGKPVTEQQAIDWLRARGLTEIHTQPRPVEDHPQWRVSRTWTIVGNQLQESA